MLTTEFDAKHTKDFKNEINNVQLVQRRFNTNWPVKVVAKDIAMNEGALRFDSQAGLIGRNVANGSPPLRRFFEALLPRR